MPQVGRLYAASDCGGPYGPAALKRESSLFSSQFKVLDIVNPLLCLMGMHVAWPDQPTFKLCSAELRLWVDAFHNITKSRRLNVLKVTDPKLKGLLRNPELFSVEEISKLFGRNFLDHMVGEADVDAKLQRGNLARRGPTPRRSRLRHVSTRRPGIQRRGAQRTARSSILECLPTWVVEEEVHRTTPEGMFSLCTMLGITFVSVPGLKILPRTGGKYRKILGS